MVWIICSTASTRRRIAVAPRCRPSSSRRWSATVNIAYQIVGDNGPDLVFVMGWVSHVEYFWTHPRVANFFRRLAGFLAADSVRQARHRTFRSRDDDAGLASTDGRRSRGDGRCRFL